MRDGALLVRGIAVGVCGTDREIAQGAYGTPPLGETTLVIGHESLGEVLEAPVGSGFAPGDLVVGIVRRPDPTPCPACAAGEWDMCRNDGFGERGIVRLHGYGSQQWRVEPDFAVPILPRLGELGVLLEPASVLAKAWDQVDQISRRAFFLRRRALVTGAGPIGLMACLLGVHAATRCTSSIYRWPARNVTSWRPLALTTTPVTRRTSTWTSTWSSSAPVSGRSDAPPASDWPAAESCA